MLSEIPHWRASGKKTEVGHAKNPTPPFHRLYIIWPNPSRNVQLAKLKWQLKLLKWAAFNHWLQELNRRGGIKIFERQSEISTLISAQGPAAARRDIPTAARFAEEPDGSPWCPHFSQSSESGMQRRHGSHGVLPGDWSSHSKPHHPHRQLRHPASGLSHLLHPVRLPRQRPFQGVRFRAPSPPAAVSHPARGDAKLPGLVAL